MIALIVAHDRKRVIGFNGRIPWQIEGEQKRFKELTTGNVVVMGRRTYEEIGHPLPARDTIVVATRKQFHAENCTTVATLDEAIRLAGESDVFLSGGTAIYEEALQRDLVEMMYITVIDFEVEGDRCFPEFSEDRFVCESIERIEAKPDGTPAYEYRTYRRR